MCMRVCISLCISMIIHVLVHIQEFMWRHLHVYMYIYINHYSKSIYIDLTIFSYNSLFVEQKSFACSTLILGLILALN